MCKSAEIFCTRKSSLSTLRMHVFDTHSHAHTHTQSQITLHSIMTHVTDRSQGNIVPSDLRHNYEQVVEKRSDTRCDYPNKINENRTKTSNQNQLIKNPKLTVIEQFSKL